MESDSFMELFTHHTDKILLDLTAGSISGICNCLTSHPMDTVKVRMQISKDSMFQVIRNTMKQEGILAFFKGMEFPLLAVPAINACVFSTYEFWKRILQTDDLEPMAYWKTTVCGMFAGSTVALISTPIELAKCKLQTQKYIQYRGPFDCIYQLYKQEGIKGPFQGMFATQYREILGYGAQFLVYELVRSFLSGLRNDTNPTNLELLVAGGLGGVACWLFSYPQDVQYPQKSGNRLYKRHPLIPDGGYFDCQTKILQRDGWRGLWRGFDACLIRAFYANAIGFYSYELSKEYLLNKYATSKMRE